MRSLQRASRVPGDSMRSPWPSETPSLARLAGDFAHMNIVEIRAALVALVPDLVMRHPLRGYDAVQLAAALTVRTSGMAVEFWSSDVGLCQAAATEGLRVVNPN
jgi:hypothetical protein